jgi:hypothetical protein
MWISGDGGDLSVCFVVGFILELMMIEEKSRPTTRVPGSGVVKCSKNIGG